MVADLGQSGAARPCKDSVNYLKINYLLLGTAIALSMGERSEMKKGLLILAAALMTLAPMSASAAVRGFVVVGGPYYGGFYRPYWGPYWGSYYYAHPNSGEIKLDTKVKDAQVFINGAFAGTTHDNKTMYLRPGSYNIEIKQGTNTPFAQKIYVVAGKTLHLHPEL
jgi:hypothetical protein